MAIVSTQIEKCHCHCQQATSKEGAAHDEHITLSTNATETGCKISNSKSDTLKQQVCQE